MALPIWKLPVRELMRAYRALRRQFFTVGWPEDAPAVVVEDDPETVEWALRKHANFESGVTMSFRYDGEVLNLRRPETVVTRSEDSGTVDIQMQLHIRARPHPARDGAWEYVGHEEADPDEHPRRHLNSEGFAWNAPLVRTVLAGVNIESEVET